MLKASCREKRWLLSASRTGRKHTPSQRIFVNVSVHMLRRHPGARARDGPTEPAPDYSEIDKAPLNRTIMSLFRKKMVKAVGRDSGDDGYDAIIDLTRELNAMHAEPEQTQQATHNILRSLFPSWLPPAFKAMFARPAPQFSNKLNAWVTSLTCQWLMGPNAVNDVELRDGTVAPGQGVKVERCRYLEESGCASICINSCKVPTQRFFQEDMGMEVSLEPDYEDFSCQFIFGQAPPASDPAFSVPCLQQCPSKRRVGGEFCEGTLPLQDRVPMQSEVYTL